MSHLIFSACPESSSLKSFREQTQTRSRSTTRKRGRAVEHPEESRPAPFWSSQFSATLQEAASGVHLGTKAVQFQAAEKPSDNTTAPTVSPFANFLYSDKPNVNYFKFSSCEPSLVDSPLWSQSQKGAVVNLLIRQQRGLKAEEVDSAGLSLKTAVKMESSTSTAEEEKRLREYQLSLLVGGGQKHKTSQELKSAPIFTHQVLKNSSAFTQYGFLAGRVSGLAEESIENEKAVHSSDLEQSASDLEQSASDSEKLESDWESSKPESDSSKSFKSVTDTGPDTDVDSDPRLYFNIAAPSSAFICGSQGSGKSHTLSCLLENCVIKSDVSKLNNPLTGLVLHFDTFTSDAKGTPCEAAYLSSHKGVEVRVLCSPTNIETIKRTYAGLNVKVEALRIDESHLNTKRMLDLMAVNVENGPMPLYLHSINRILREMRIEQQAQGGSFKYAQFKKRVEDTDLTPHQKVPLEQRLDTLESFMDKSQTSLMGANHFKKRETNQVVRGNDWTIKPGSLTIIDLSCPCMTSEGACALFNICLGIFLEQKTTTGRIIALDEAHKYMNEATEAANLTETLLQAIRLQRHLGTRVVISTQEPTISPKLIDLCSMTIVHRFSSPEWLRCLRLHLAALNNDGIEQKSDLMKVFSKIVRLNVGEALLFAPSATTSYKKDKNGEQTVKKLGVEYLKIVVRGRITADGGKSVMAN